LRNTNVSANLYGGEIVDPAVFPYPRMLADDEFPGEFNSDAWFDYDAVSDNCAKHAEQCDS